MIKKSPRYFTHTTGYDSDAAFVRFDDPLRICTVVTINGTERPPNGQPNRFTLDFVLRMQQLGEAKEITEAEAKGLINL
jgi:hypothetical protein